MKTFAHNPFVKIAHKSLAYILVFCIVNMPVWALSGFNAISGSASYNGSDTVTLNQLRAVIEWNDFDTIPNQLIQFLDGGALTPGHAVLNRVTGGVMTQFDGILEGGQGHILLINPQGIMIGSTAVINAGRFTASTMHLQMSDTDFLAGETNFEFAKGNGDPAAQIALLAGSNVTAERVDLLAQQINNAGTITTETGGVVVMAAGDRVFLGEAGSDIIVEMSGIENGMVTNDGTITAPEGTIVMAAGDIYSTTLGMKVFDGAGKVAQNGTLNVDGTVSGEGDGGTIQMLAGEEVTLTAGSLTTANAIPDDADPMDLADGGDIIIESTETVNIDMDAYLSAKGNGWYDVDENFRFDFGVDTSFSGSIQIFGKYLNLPSPDDYTATDSFSDHFDLLGYNEGPLQQLQSGFFTIGNNEGDMTIAEGPLPGSPAANTVYEEWIEDVSLEGIHVDVLSSGDITFNDLNLGVAKDEGLVGGAGNMAFRTRFEDGGIFMDDLTDIIKTLDGGDVFMVAGSGGITIGEIDIENEDRTGDPGQIILATANGGDISTETLFVKSGNREIVSISSSGDVTIDGGVLVSTNEVPDAIDKTATAEICIDAGDDIDITGSIEADAHGKVEMFTSIHIDAGLNPESNDDGENQAGIININLDGGQIVAISEESGPDPEGTNDLISVATIEIHTSAVGEDAIKITNGKAGGNQAIQVRAKVQGQSPVGDSLPANDPTDYYEERISLDGGVNKTQIVNVEIQSGYDVTECDDCVKPPFLPPTPKFFFIKNDQATIDWRAGYTIVGDQAYDPADLDVLLNDNGPGVPLFEADIIGADGDPIVLITEKGGTLEWVQFDYTDGDGVTHTYDGFLYTPPSYTEDFEWDGVSDYATFTDSFQYRAQIGDDVSLNIATVTLTVQNEVPTLAGDSDTIHMNTSKDFDLSTLVTDNDGTPGELTGEFTGTYGDLSYDIVEGFIPVSNGDIATDSGLITDTLTISGDTITYAPLDGYVSPTGEPTTFGYTVTDDNITDAVFELPDGEDLDVTVTNTLPSGDVTLEDAPMNADGETLSQTGGNDFTDADSDPFAIVSIDPATDDYNKAFGGTLDYNGQKDPYVTGDDYDYSADAALPGYVGEDDFVATLWDGQKTYYVDGSSEEVYGSGTIDIDVVNDRPDGDSWLGTTSMDTALTDASLATDGFSDINGDTFSVEIDGVSSDDYNGDFGGSLTYNGTDYDYDPTAMGLPGYTGDDVDDFDDGGYDIGDNADDRFDVKLWDGEYLYTFDDQGGFERTKQYGEGTISVDITNELPESDAWFGQVHMDSQGVVQDLEIDFAPSITVDADSYTGSVIDSDNYGGTLVFDGTTWTYSTDTTLPGYVGDDNDDFNQSGHVADDLFNVNLSNGQFDYWFSEDPAPDGYEYYEPGDIYRKAVFSDGTGTVSVDITNALPTIDETTTIEHMDETIMDQLFATDHLDGNPINELDDLKTLDGSGNETSGYSSDFGIWVPVDNDNPDGTSTYTYVPADGYVGEDSFEVTVWDGQINYVFVDGEIDTEASTKETVSGTVSLEYTNILPSGNGDLGTTESGTTLTVGQSGTTSPVVVIDFPDLPQQSIDDFLSIPNGTYTGSGGGTLVYNGTDWIYTPAPGFEGQETFTIDVWDGQNAYGSHIEGGIQGPVYGQGTVTVTVSELPPPPPIPTPDPEPLPLAPIAPLADYEIPRLVGCPAEMEAAQNELAVNSDELQLLIANAMATNPNLQPCDACASLVTAARTLKQMESSQHVAALAQIFNSQAPIDAPFTPEVSASVATALANFREMETELAIMTAEQYDEYQQYALADELVEAFVSYVAVLENDLRLPVGDSVAMVMDKYGEAIEATGNANIIAYLIAEMEAARVVSEPIAASID